MADKGDNRTSEEMSPGLGQNLSLAYEIGHISRKFCPNVVGVSRCLKGYNDRQKST